MTTFLAIYRGRSIREAEIVAVTTDPAFVREVAGRILQTTSQTTTDESDPVLRVIKRGRKSALKMIVGNAKENDR